MRKQRILIPDNKKLHYTKILLYFYYTGGIAWNIIKYCITKKN